MKNISSIVKKELRGYSVNPTTYIIAGVFLAVWEFLFFQNVFLVGEASLQGLFHLLPWFFLLLIPALTMGSIAEENNKETLEALLTHPLDDRELLLGKFFSTLIFACVLLLASVPIVFSLHNFGDIDFGVFVGQYVASLFLASSLIALGVAVSAHFKNQVPALLLSVVGTFILVIMGSDIVTISLPAWLGGLFSRISVLPHFNSLARGVLDIRDLWYFVLLSVLFLQIGHIRLVLRRTSKYSKKVLRERVIALALFVIFLVTSGFSFFPTLRADLTEGNIYTLTDTTKKILSDVSEDITITLYESANLPAQFQPISRTVKDVLRDYKTYGGAKLTIAYKDPDADQSIAEEAQKAGVYPARFNMVGNGELQVKQSYFGLSVASTNGEEKAIPLIQDTADLEYQLTSFVYELTDREKKKVTFLETTGGKTLSNAYTTLSTELKKQFIVESQLVTEATSTVSDDTDVVVVGGPSNMFDELTAQAVRDALSKGKNILFMVDTLEVNVQYMMVLPNGTSSDDVLKEYGITVNSDLVYDLRSNHTVQVGGAGIQYFLPYPLYIRASVIEGAFVGSTLSSVLIPWGSSVSVNDTILNSKGFASIPLVYTTQFAGKQEDNYIINPQEKFSNTDLEQQVLGVLIKPLQDDEGVEGSASRMVVMGDSDFLSDAYGQPENIAFGMELISYLAQEDSLAGIKIKQSTSRPLMFKDPKQTTWIQYGNILGVLLFLTFMGSVIIVRRRGMRTMTYKEGKNR